MSTGFTEPLVHAPQSNQKRYSYRGGLGIAPAAEYVVLHEDFLHAVSSNAPTGWTAIIDAGATLTSGTSDAGGIVDITSDGVDEGVGIYLPQSIQLSGKKFFIEARVKLEDADDNIIAIGLSDLSATTDPEDLYDTSNADGISFGTTVDGDATPVLVYDKDNGGPVTDTPSGTTYDLTDGNWHTIAIAYNGATTPGSGSLKAYVDGNEAVSVSTPAQVPEDVVLSPFVAGLVEDDASDVIKVDYVRIGYER